MKAPKRAFVLPFVFWSLLPPGVTPVAGSPVPTTRPRPAPAVQLVVDATDAPRTLFRAHEVIPARPGPLTLAYPKWIPGEHRPTGAIVNLSGLRFTAAGTVLPWRRDPIDMYSLVGCTCR